MVAPSSCSVPTRLSIVWAARAAAAQNLSLDRRGGLARVSLSPPTIGRLAWDVALRLPRLLLRGQARRVAQIDSASALSPTGWQPLLTVNLPEARLDWLHTTVGSVSRQFYRLTLQLLPAGTRIMIQGEFDNSELNLANSDPSATVTWGDQTSSEMFVGFIDYVD
jgi:hypothetical protein